MGKAARAVKNVRAVKNGRAEKAGGRYELQACVSGVAVALNYS